MQNHEAHSIGYYLCCSYDDQISKYRSYRCTAAEWFVEELVKIADLLESIHEEPVPMKKLTKE